MRFGGQTPLKLARAIEDAGYRILGTPFDAVDLAEDRERFGLLRAHGLRWPEWGIAVSLRTRPSRSPSESATRCSSGPRTSWAGERCASATRPRKFGRCLRIFERILVDRFVEVEVDVDALCDSIDTYVGAVMQHVEEAGVHSGDWRASCPRPASRRARRSRVSARILGRSLGGRGFLNVQLAVTGDGDVYVIEANPRASRTVPFVARRSTAWSS